MRKDALETGPVHLRALSGRYSGKGIQGQGRCLSYGQTKEIYGNYKRRSDLQEMNIILSLFIVSGLLFSLYVVFMGDDQ